MATTLAHSHRDEIAEMLSAAIDLCRKQEPKTARDLEAILGAASLSLDAEASESGQDWLMVALRMFVAAAIEVDEHRLGSILACIRYLSVRAKIATRDARTLH